MNRGRAWAALLFLPFGLGCARVTRDPAEDGARASVEEINAAIARAMGPATARPARVGQSVSYLNVRHLGGGAQEISLGGSTMTTVEDPTEPGAPKLLIDVTARTADGHFKTTRRESKLATLIPGARARANVANLSEAPADPVISYHELRVATEDAPVPAAVRAKPNCGGVPSCAWPVHYVIFDVVSRAGTAAPTRVTLTLGFSHQTPYLPFGDGVDRFNGALVVDCRASRVTVDDHALAVKDCRRLVDFED